MKRRIVFGICLCLFSTMAISGTATALSLGDADYYNAFVFENFIHQNSDVEGRLAAGGNISIESYAVGSGLNTGDEGSEDALVAGGNLWALNGQINGGDAVVGGSATLQWSGIDGGSLTENADLPIDFAAQAAYLTGLSAQLASITTTGTVQELWQGGFHFSGDGTSELQAFTMSAEQLARTNTFKMLDNAGIPDNATLVFNISGDTVAMGSFGMEQFKNALGNSYDNVLFNFYEATALDLYSIGIKGSILAPFADVTAVNGHMDGTLIAKSWQGNLELHNVLFESTPNPAAPVPEPGTLALLFSGMFGLAGVSRRKS